MLENSEEEILDHNDLKTITENINHINPTTSILSEETMQCNLVNSDEDVAQNVKRRATVFFSDSDSNSSKSQQTINNLKKNGLSVDDSSLTLQPKIRNTRIKNYVSSSDSDGDCSEKNDRPNEFSSNAFGISEHQRRMKKKRNKLKDKFKNLNKVREQDRFDKTSVPNTEFHKRKGVNEDNQSTSEEDDEAASIIKIKQKIKERSITLKSTIYDTDTSDEESSQNKGKLKNVIKSTQMSPPKKIRMSAKQAMENMQKIKSESNRMLREKEVSLPYHRPKALALKDVLNRRKPVVSSDGKALPLKMNNEQLKEYVKLLEQRQKEVIELCKSDSDDQDEEYNNQTFDEKADICNDINKNNILISNHQDNQNKENNHEDKRNVAVENNLILTEDNKENFNSNENSESKFHNNGSIEQRALDNDESYDNIIQSNTNNIPDKNKTVNFANTELEPDSQMISLQYDSEQMETNTVDSGTLIENEENKNQNTSIENDSEAVGLKYGFSDDELEMEDIDRLIEETDVVQSQATDSPMLIRENISLTHKPKLTGAPGMVIDLDGSNDIVMKKISGVELLKQRFTYFNKLKSAKEIEQETQQRIKPGTQHLKLKQELEEQMAQQKSLEWAKRLEEERLRKSELNALRGDDSDQEDDIDKLEAKLAEPQPDDQGDKEVESFAESEPEEDDVVLEDKTRKKSSLIDDEAEESDDENKVNNDEFEDEKSTKHNQKYDVENESSDDSSDNDTTDEDDDENGLESKQKKGRILKAFEDSEDELDNTVKIDTDVKLIENCNESLDNNKTINSNSQDDEIQSAQLQKSISEDIFTTQDTDLHSSKSMDIGLISKKDSETVIEKLSVICETQPYDDAKFDEIANMCSGTFSQNVLTTQIEPIFSTDAASTQETPFNEPQTLVPDNSQEPSSETQQLGDDVLAMCTGKFYDSEFVSQQKENVEKELEKTKPDSVQEKSKDENLLKSILLELDDPEFDNPKPNKFFASDCNLERNDENVQKKRLIIESDDETTEAVQKVSKKKRKKRKLQDRALQISDDEEEVLEEDNSDYESSKVENDSERLVEYDSEENEVEIQAPQKKIKRKTTEFFEQEAELTSEDEWVGSGDEDEAGLDRMEREEGDADHFHQATLQRELGQIHMREVLDQDKREVRLIQELLFEDGDLGEGHRQRKFRWKHIDGDMGGDSIMNDMINTQEDELESEEQWRKQRHEREVFLRQMMNKNIENESMNTSLTRTDIIKANLASKSISSLLHEVNSPQSKVDLPTTDKKTAKDLPSPVKKAFPMLQHNYRSSLLSRGSGTLARLAAIASPLAGEGDEKATTVKGGAGNFVFSTVSPKPADEVKVSKRKKLSDVGTPQLLKKIKIEDKRDPSKPSLLDHMKA